MLPQTMRLRRRGDFDRTYRRGRAKATAALVLYAKKNSGGLRIGFSVSKKVGNAVARNRIKRRLRHIVRETMALFPKGYDYVFVIRQSALALRHDQLTLDVRKLIQGVME